MSVLIKTAAPDVNESRRHGCPVVVRTIAHEP